MTFLKRLGQILLTISATAVGIGPLVTPLFGAKGTQVGSTIATVTNDLTSIGGVIVQIETAFASMQGATGPQKLQAAASLVGPILKTSQIVAGKKIANEVLFNQAATEIAQGVVDLLNSLDAGSVDKEVKA